MKGIILTEAEVSQLEKIEVDGLNLNFRTGKLKDGTYFFNSNIIKELKNKTIKGIDLGRKAKDKTKDDFIE